MQHLTPPSIRNSRIDTRTQLANTLQRTFNCSLRPLPPPHRPSAGLRTIHNRIESECASRKHWAKCPDFGVVAGAVSQPPPPPRRPKFIATRARVNGTKVPANSISFQLEDNVRQCTHTSTRSSAKTCAHTTIIINQTVSAGRLAAAVAVLLVAGKTDARFACTQPFSGVRNLFVCDSRARGFGCHVFYLHCKRNGRP